MQKLINKVFETNFTVFPQHTNYMPPMIFGGKMMSEMDIAAAMAARRACIDSPLGVRHAVTTAVNNIQFHIGAVVGDLIFLKAEIVKLGVKSITIHVDGEREKKDGYREKICEGDFVFVTVEFLENLNQFSQHRAVPHGLKMEEQ